MNQPRINPNKELLAFSKYDSMLRRNGFKPSEQMAIKRMALQVQRDSEWNFCQKLPLLIFGIVINVLHGNHYLSGKKIQAVVEECCELYYEVDLALLDIDDVIAYNEREAKIIVEPKNIDDMRVEKPSFKVSGMTSHMERLSKIVADKEAELIANLDVVPDDEESIANLRFLNALKNDMVKAGLMNDK